MTLLRVIVGILGNVTAIFLFGAPIITFTRVIRNKSTEEFSCIPYLISLLACVSYTWYSTPVISYGWENAPLFSIDGIGGLLELSFIIIYLRFAPVKEKIRIGAMFALLIVTSIVMILVSIFVFHDHPHRKILIGSVAIVGATSMYGSPLVAMKTVIRTKSVEFMPFYLSLFTFVASTLWAIYGLLDLDFFIATPNMIGSVLGIVQLVLYFKYKKKEGLNEGFVYWDRERMEAQT
ncbi:hypothetical protein K2173_008721 [Erythroxylum novogranatense]|uniref:Bidirectional sugar transporter SWEET n=1 Tax=Erythroxylum novogranatense TaxID=1862640 RepID=A0AAV8SLU8_9ROSI|nr:hypothetical protein K2173_008721 [Erythroxylum novogranatense]